jgi:hypothetical protein
MYVVWIYDILINCWVCGIDVWYCISEIYDLYLYIHFIIIKNINNIYYYSLIYLYNTILLLLIQKFTFRHTMAFFWCVLWDTHVYIYVPTYNSLKWIDWCCNGVELLFGIKYWCALSLSFIYDIVNEILKFKIYFYPKNHTIYHKPNVGKA